MAAWASFFQIAAEAAATLLGMLIVAISINLARIIETPRLPERAAGALAPLAGALIVSSLALVPGQPLAIFGAEALVCTLGVWIIAVRAVLRGRPTAALVTRHWTLLHLSLAQLQTLPIIAGGAIACAGSETGLYWMVPGLIAAFLGGVLNTWVLLVEILR